MLDFTFALALPLLVGAVWFVTKIRPLSVETELQRLYERFQWERRGSSFEDRQTELTLRTAAARLRRVASDAVLANPRRYLEIIEHHAQQEAALLAALDRQVAKQFLEWVAGASVDEILYRPAMKLVWAEMRRNAEATATRMKRSPAEVQDRLAALKVAN